MQDFTDQIADFIASSPSIAVQLVETVAIILILWVVRIIAVRVLQRNVEDKKAIYKWRKNITYIAFFIGVLIIGQIWFLALGSLGTFLGLLSAGIAIALKDPVTDIAAWLFLIWRKPFDIGDRIQVGNSKGDVIDIRVFKFTILEIGNWVDADQSTGRVIHIPNHKVFTEDLANYTSDFEFIWNEMGVLVTFESDWKKAKKILEEVVEENMHEFVEQAREEVKKAEKSYLIQYRYLTPIVYTSVKDSGINLSIRYLSDPRRRRGVSQAIWESILDRFDEHDDIDFAYPTIRYYDNPTEGKPGTTPSGN
ncbi:MAG: mechanosensitive ion channel family protein [Gracilimonas sp.]|uniref:mechanosensitive ion channel family protein n=1 Tax=Gracilimonas TaxID=649462 RepID=UPI001B1132F0|nr:mechanosensitive ion channel domain-containing protein [Gracilimonas sp.]MBO6585195.1 mechanosensitive ion channel family protein [Gracilimonas sp.]MBO6615533.1 mechanosensitive ion channel family protein [Gracilimonas sp.]